MTPIARFAAYNRMADWIEQHGFSPEWSTLKGCGCFAHAMVVIAGFGLLSQMPELRSVVKAGNSFDAGPLRRAGWDETATADAAAACRIAAALALHGGKP